MVLDYVELIADYEKISFRRNQVESDGIFWKFLQKQAETRCLKLLNHVELIADHQNVIFRWNQLESNGISLNFQYQQTETHDSRV